MPLAEDVVLDHFAGITHGFVGADLQALTREAAMHTLRRFLPEIDLELETIPPEILQRIFEPFFSTKQGGAGLGLAIAYQIVGQNKGRLTVSSEEDSVQFRFHFRAPNETAENPAPPAE